MKLTGICALAGVLLAAGCGGDSDTAGTETPLTTVPRTTPAGTPTTTTTPSTTPTRPPQRAGTTVRIDVVDGAPQGGIQRPTVERGTRITIVVRSDLADHVHVHGYDRLADIPAGGSAQISFVADIPGRFEIELEERRVLLAQLTVS